MVRCKKMALAGLLALGASLSGQAAPFKGWVSYSSDGNANRCVGNVENSFQRLRKNGEDMGFRMGVAPDVSLTHHWQGVQRAHRPGQDKYMYVSRSKDSSNYGGIAVVNLSSRDGDGLRFRSNRLSYNDIQDTAPPWADKANQYVRTYSGQTGTKYDHAGGMQVWGNTLAVAVEGIVSSGSSNLQSEVLFYNIDNPAVPVQMPYTIQRTSSNAGTVALVKRADGRFIVMVETGEQLDFYQTDATALANPNTVATFTQL